MEVTIAGAGVSGLGAALWLGRAGHRVTIVERDATPLPDDPSSAFGWDRRGAPQVRHSHAFLARLRNLLLDRHPDVLDDLLDAGATELRFAELLPPDIVDRAPKPGDERLIGLACRRTTFEWVLHRAVDRLDNVRILDDVAVGGVIGGPDPSGLLRVAGVHGLRGGQPLHLPADLVVVANGRRSNLSAWLADVGAADLVEVTEDTGIVYFSRFYRLLDGATPPVSEGPVAADLGYLKFAVFEGDNRTFSITMAVANDDRAMRSALSEAAGFEAAARSIPTAAPWLDVSTPLSAGVEVMARLINRHRTFVVDGRPIALGLAAVGDANICTNPLYGRGCSLGLVSVDLLTEALALDASHEDQLLAYDAAVQTEIAPWYRASVQADRATRQFAAGETPADDPSLGIRELLRDGLRPAMRTNPDVFRAFIKSFNLLTTPEALMTDPAVLGPVMEAYQERDSRPPDPPMGPDRDELLDLLAAA